MVSAKDRLIQEVLSIDNSDGSVKRRVENVRYTQVNV